MGNSNSDQRNRYSGNSEKIPRGKSERKFQDQMFCRSLLDDAALLKHHLDKLGVKHLRCINANKYLNVRERVDMVERNKDGPFSSLYCKLSVSVKENSDR